MVTKKSIGIIIWIYVFTEVRCEVSEQLCAKFSPPVFLQPGQLPITALASFQGSGNTWIRQTLAAATGYKMGDIYKSYGDDVYPEFSSRHDDTVLASKIHNFAYSVAQGQYNFTRAIVAIRNPLDALFAEFNRMYGGNKTGYADIKHILHEDGTTTWKWDTWTTHMSSWVDFHKYWLEEFEGDVHIVYYNNLKNNMSAELYELIKFLGLTPDITRIECTVKYPKKPYFKRGKNSQIDKSDLFRLSQHKAESAINMLKAIIQNNFDIDSNYLKNLDLNGSWE